MKRTLLLFTSLFFIAISANSQACNTFEGLGPVQAKFGINVFGQPASTFPVVPLYWNRFYKANELTGQIESWSCAYPADPNIHELGVCACILSDFYFRKVTPNCDPTGCGGDPDLPQLPKTDNNNASSTWSSTATWIGGQVPDISSSIAVLLTKNTSIDADLVFPANHWLLLSVGNVLIQAGKTLSLNSTIQIKPTAQLENFGIIKGPGQILGSFTNSGTLSPGNSPGKFTIVGNYTATNTATHEMEIASAILYDTIVIDQDISAPAGIAVLNGALNVSLLDGYTPSSGDVYKIMTFASATGTFTTVNLPALRPGLSWALNYNTTDITLQVTGVLPVTITSFKADKKDHGVQAVWTTVSEVNVKKYEVQKSTDGLSFISAGTVNANGGTTNQYAWFDAAPFNGKNYYRIKAIDIDDAVKYSKTLTIDIVANESIAVYPNPVKRGGTMQLNLQSHIALKVQIINNMGQVLYNKSGKLSGVITIPVSVAWAFGQYILQITDENNVQTQKILVH